MTAVEILSAISIVLGAAFMAIAALGTWRMPDIFTRLHCSAKAATLGASLTLIGAAAIAGDFSMIVRCIAVIGFLIITAPAGAHLIARAAYRSGEASATAANPTPATQASD